MKFLGQGFQKLVTNRTDRRTDAHIYTRITTRHSLVLINSNAIITEASESKTLLTNGPAGYLQRNLGQICHALFCRVT